MNRYFRAGVAAAVAAAAFGAGPAVDTAAGFWLDVPYVPQVEQGCGAAAAAMVIRYWEDRLGLPTQGRGDHALILEKLHSDRLGGILGSELVSYFETQGYLAFAFQGKQDDLRAHLIKGRPLIVAFREGGRSSPNHFAVVVGFDDRDDAILFNDPALRKLARRDRKRFERSWKAAGNWTLLAVPHSADDQVEAVP